MKIHVIVYDAWNGDGMDTRIIKAFMDEQEAKNFVDNCETECKRIIDEVKAHNEKYRDELWELGNVVRDLILENGRKKKPLMIDFSKLPESQRRQAINEIENDIFKSHKFDSEFRDFYDEFSYNIEEVELT